MSGKDEGGERRQAGGFWDSLTGKTRQHENRRFVSPYEQKDLMGGECLRHPRPAVATSQMMLQHPRISVGNQARLHASCAFADLS